MTVASRPLGRAVPSASIRALARVEARALLSHPAFLCSGALSLLFTVLALTGAGETNSGSDEAQLLSFLGGFATLPLAFGTSIAANLAVLRPARARGEDVGEAAPMSDAARTVAHLLSLVAPVGVAASFVVVVFIVSGAFDGLSVEFVDGRALVRPSRVELAQGPAVVLALGALGISVATLVRRSVFAYLIVVPAVPQIIAVSWLAQGTLQWFAPMSNALIIHRWNDVSVSYSYPTLDAVARSAMAWHLAYVIGLACVAAGVALRRSGAGWRLLGLGVVATAAGGAGQLISL